MDVKENTVEEGEVAADGDAAKADEAGPVVAPIKKRRWGSSQVSKSANKKPTLVISTDSLKVC